jgi:hypothetical protein
MPLYVIRLTHPPDQCPTANSKIREMLAKGVPALPQLAEKLGIKFLAGPLVIGRVNNGVQTAVLCLPNAILPGQ